MLVFAPITAEIADPLYQSTTMSPFVWTQEADEVFKMLKLALTNPPILAYPDPNGTFVLDTDASSSGIGAVLSQQHV